MGQVVRGGEQFETAIAADFRGQILKRGPDSGQVDATIEGNTTAQWRLRPNPTITSGTWAPAANGRGNVETLTAATISGGTIVAAGLVGTRGSTAFATESALALALGTNADGSSDVLVLTMEADSSTKGLGLLGWREFV